MSWSITAVFLGLFALCGFAFWLDWAEAHCPGCRCRGEDW